MSKAHTCQVCRGSGEDSSQSDGKCRHCGGQGFILRGRPKVIGPRRRLQSSPAR